MHQPADCRSDRIAASLLTFQRVAGETSNEWLKRLAERNVRELSGKAAQALREDMAKGGERQ